MQFPRHCVAPRFHIVGIATFVDTVENSFNRIACETAASALAACVPRRARGSDTSCVGLMVCAWAAPRRISRGWRACHGVNAHCQRFMCERHTRWRRCVHNAGHLAHDTPLSAFVTEVVCDLGATPSRGATSLPRTVTSLPRTVTSLLRTAASLTASGGSCAARGPVRDVPAGDIATKRGELHH